MNIGIALIIIAFGGLLSSIANIRLISRMERLEAAVRLVVSTTHLAPEATSQLPKYLGGRKA